MCKFKFHHFHVLLIIYHMYNATNMVMHIRDHIANHPPPVFLLSKIEVSKYVEAAAAHPFTGSAAERGAGGGTMVNSYLPFHSCNTFGACDLCTVHYNILNHTSVCRTEHGLSKICCFPRVTQMKLSYLCTLHTKWA